MQHVTEMLVSRPEQDDMRVAIYAEYDTEDGEAYVGYPQRGKFLEDYLPHFKKDDVIDLTPAEQNDGREIIAEEIHAEQEPEFSYSE